MFGKLAQEKHDRMVISDHARLIREAVEDVEHDDYSGDEIDVSDLDKVMDNDGDAIPQSDIDELDTLIGSIVDRANPDVAKMTRDEIQQYVSSVQTPTINELDQ